MRNLHEPRDVPPLRTRARARVEREDGARRAREQRFRRRRNRRRERATGDERGSRHRDAQGTCVRDRGMHRSAAALGAEEARAAREPPETRTHLGVVRPEPAVDAGTVREPRRHPVAGEEARRLGAVDGGHRVSDAGEPDERCERRLHDERRPLARVTHAAPAARGGSPRAPRGRSRRSLQLTPPPPRH